MQNRKRRKARTIFSRQQIETKVKNAFYRIPKWQRKYLASTKEEEKLRIMQMIKMFELAQEQGERISPYKAFYDSSEKQARHSGEGTRRFLYKILKSEWINVYTHYNTYLYNLGYSASNYFYDPQNSDIKQAGSVIEFTLNLPVKTKGIIYDELYMEYDFSGGFSYAEMN